MEIQEPNRIAIQNYKIPVSNQTSFISLNSAQIELLAFKNIELHF